MGFDSGELKRMILEDKLGQTATVIFDHIERNRPVSPQEVSFTPPAGVDVIGSAPPEIAVDVDPGRLQAERDAIQLIQRIPAVGAIQ